jgi:hypothetical protein
MVKNSLVLALLAALVASSSVALATPVDFYGHDYDAYAYAENTATGECVEDSDASQKGINVSAQQDNTIATASAKNNGYLLYADANAGNVNGYAESWASAILSFSPNSTDVRLKFDYGIEADTAGNAAAEAIILVSFIDYEQKPKTIFSLTASDAESYSGSFNKVLHSLEFGEAYSLWLEIFFVGAEACLSDNSTAHACGWISNLTVRNLDQDPPAVPLPGASLLLTSGLLRLLVWARRKQS